MGSSLNYGPILGSRHSTGTLMKKGPKRDPSLENNLCD